MRRDEETGLISARLFAGSFLRRTTAVVGLLMGVATASSAISAEDYSAQWGPALGAQLPVLEAFDQAGNLRTLENLSGDRGLLLVMSRSADW